MAQEWAIKQQRQQQPREGNRHRVVYSVCGRRIKIVAGKLAINEQQAEANQGIIRSESVNFSSVSCFMVPATSALYIKEQEKKLQFLNGHSAGVSERANCLDLTGPGGVV